MVWTLFIRQLSSDQERIKYLTAHARYQDEISKGVWLRASSIQGHLCDVYGSLNRGGQKIATLTQGTRFGPVYSVHSHFLREGDDEQGEYGLAVGIIKRDDAEDPWSSAFDRYYVYISKGTQ